MAKKKILTEKPEEAVETLEVVEEALVKVYIKVSYYDLKLKKNIYYGTTLEVTEERAAELVSKGIARRV